MWTLGAEPVGHGPPGVMGMTFKARSLGGFLSQLLILKVGVPQENFRVPSSPLPPNVRGCPAKGGVCGQCVSAFPTRFDVASFHFSLCEGGLPPDSRFFPEDVFLCMA